MGGSRYPIVGIQTGRGKNGEVPVKMEVDDWWGSKDPIHLNQQTLLFTALTKMYEASPHDRLSFYQIAGIHQQPIVPWDDAPFENKNYCMHSTPNFPTWHRPYNVLLEQRLYEVMINDIIPHFPKSDQADLKKAADVWRFPYWDFATKKADASGVRNYNVPKLIREKEVEVRVPGGTARIPNPFYQFKMPDGLTMGDKKLGANAVTREPYTRTKGTSRHLYVDGAKEEDAYTNEEHALGVQNNDGVKDKLQEFKWEGGGSLDKSLRDWCYRVLMVTPFEVFADDKADPGESDTGRYSSLESLHNDLHEWGGGKFGHMAEPSVGAFDPFFWLLHNNVDRMLELWIGLHPKEARDWIENDSDAVIPLIPFRKDQGEHYHTAQSVWRVEDFGYTYPETQRWKPKYKTDGKFDENKLATDLAQLMNKKYNSAAAAQRKAFLTKTRDVPIDKTIASAVAVAIDQAPKISALIKGIGGLGTSLSAIPDGKIEEEVLPDIIEARDYVANVIFEKYALDGYPFTIRFFIGQVPEGGYSEISRAQTQVGEIYNFVDPVEFDKPNCENCARQARAHLKITGQVPLTNALLTRFKQRIPHETDSGEKMTLQSMEPEHVVPFLREQFHWRVNDNKGHMVDKTRITGMKVSVAAGTAYHHSDFTQLSEFTDYKILYDITENSSSGTGAAPQDRLFRREAVLRIPGLT